MVATIAGILDFRVSISNLEFVKTMIRFFFRFYVHYTENDGEVGDISVDSFFTCVVIGARVTLLLLASQHVPNNIRGGIMRC